MGHLTVVLPLTLAAAACFAGAVVIQQSVASAEGATLRLLRRPRWLFGIGIDLVGFCLQVVALHFGTLALVQPLLTTTLLFGLVFSLRRLTGADWAGALALAVGLSGFLLAASPRGGGGISQPRLAFATLAVAAVGLAALASRRPVGLASGAAVCFGMVAGLAKSAGDVLVHRGVTGVLGHWQLYAMVATSLGGLVLEQQAFSSGRLVTSLVALTLGDPLTSLCLGLVVEGERISGGPAAAGALVASLVAAFGIVLLCRTPEQRAGAGDHPLVA